MGESKQGEAFAAPLGPAMRLVLMLARRRAGEWVNASVDGLEPSHVASLWEVAERHHPEEIWLAESWLRRERTLADLAASAPQSDLAPALLDAAVEVAPQVVSDARSGGPPQGHRRTGVGGDRATPPPSAT